MQNGGELFDDLANNEHFWSSPFQIDDIDDFQVSYPIDVSDRRESEEWYMPSHINGFMRFIRVIVTSQNDASILIVITNPQYPEYEIKNQSDVDIELAQLSEGSVVSRMLTNQED